MGARRQTNLPRELREQLETIPAGELIGPDHSAGRLVVHDALIARSEQ